jgi:hypothetical protein
MTNDDHRLIEDYLPIRAISAEASREKSVRKGHISTLHLWGGGRFLPLCHIGLRDKYDGPTRHASRAAEKARGDKHRVPRTALP